MAISREEELEYLRLLEEEERRKRENKLADFHPHGYQLEVLEATKTHELVALQGANGTGKTALVAYAASIWATGRYPKDWIGKRFDGAVTIIIAGRDRESLRDALEKHLLYGQEGGDRGEGFLPKDTIVEVKPSRSGMGSDYIKVTHVDGRTSTIHTKAFSKGAESIAGIRANIVIIDEPAPPDEFSELSGRLTASGKEPGLIMCSYTPTTGSSAVIRHIHEHGYVRVVSAYDASVKNGGHISEEEIERLETRYLGYERRARLLGLTAQGRGSIFEFDVGTLVNPPPDDADDTLWRYLLAIDLGVQHPFAALLTALEPNGTLNIIKEYRKTQSELMDPEGQWNSPIAQHVANIRLLMGAENFGVVWLPPHDAARRQLVSGDRIRDILKDLGVNVAPFNARWPEGSGRRALDVKDGFTEIIQRAGAGTLRIWPDCPLLIEEMRNAYWVDDQPHDEDDDLLSCLRYALMGHACKLGKMPSQMVRAVEVLNRRRNGGGSGTQVAVAGEDLFRENERAQGQDLGYVIRNGQKLPVLGSAQSERDARRSAPQVSRASDYDPWKR